MTTTAVVMGVSGSGKTTVATAVAARRGWLFAEGDAFHPEANVRKMAAGSPLDDVDRAPWLAVLGQWIAEREAVGEDAVLTCSALKRSYRDVLREGRSSVRFVHVDVEREVLRQRLARRQGHYMPASLLDSQLAALEPLGPDEPGIRVAGDGHVEAVVAAVLAGLPG